jgi:hypothetical protein
VVLQLNAGCELLIKNIDSGRVSGLNRYSRDCISHLFKKSTI